MVDLDRSHELHCWKLRPGLSPVAFRGLDLLGPGTHDSVLEMSLWGYMVMGFETGDLRRQVVVHRCCGPECQAPTVREHFCALHLPEP